MVPPQNTQAQSTQSQNTQAPKIPTVQNTQSPKIHKIEIAILIK